MALNEIHELSLINFIGISWDEFRPIIKGLFLSWVQIDSRDSLILIKMSQNIEYLLTLMSEIIPSTKRS
jgi:hypothetical protein